LRDRDAEAELDSPLAPVVGRPERRIGESAGEQLLRQRRPLVGMFSLVAGEDDPSLIAERAQVLGDAGAGETGSRDEHRPAHAAATSSTMIAPIGHESAASSTRGSSVSPTAATAVPEPSKSKTDGAASRHEPKPLQSERSIVMR